MLSPIVRGFALVADKTVVCGTSLDLRDVEEDHGSADCLKVFGEVIGYATFITSEFQPLQHKDFRAWLSCCLGDASRVDEFDLPGEVFPGAEQPVFVWVSVYRQQRVLWFGAL